MEIRPIQPSGAEKPTGSGLHFSGAVGGAFATSRAAGVSRRSACLLRSGLTFYTAAAEIVDVNGQSDGAAHEGVQEGMGW